jgi:Tfp pilus assembly protein PilF
MVDELYALRINQDPTDARAYMARALVRQRAGDAAGAAFLFRIALQLDRTLGPAWSNYGALLLEAGQVEQALVVLMEGAAQAPDHAAVFANLAGALSMEGRHEEAIGAAQTAVELDERDGDLRRNHAAVLYKAGHLDACERVLKRALAEFPEDAADFLMRLGELYAVQGEDQRAVAMLERVSALRPEEPLPYLRRAALLGRSRDLDGTLQALAEGLAHLPDNEDLRSFFAAAMSVRMRRDLEDGLERIGRDPSDVRAYVQVARVYELGRDFQAALGVLSEGVKHNPGNARLWGYVGLIQTSLAQEAAAVQAYRKAIALDGKEAGALNNCAYLLVTARDDVLHNNDEALTLVRRALALEPSNVSFMDTLAEVHFARGDVQAARGVIESALELQPRDPRLRKQAERFDAALAMRHAEKQ